MAISNRMTKYEAPVGYVYDWVEPHTTLIKDAEGNVVKEKQEHLYAKFLFLGKFDSIDSYTLVKDPKEKEN